MYAAQTTPRLTATEARILEAFLSPEATFNEVADSLKCSLKVTLQELLDALAGPAIRAAFDTLRELDALRRRLALAPIVPGALSALARLLDKSENLVEVRRAATTILSTYTRLERANALRVPRLGPPLPPSTPPVPFVGKPCDSSRAPGADAARANGHAAASAPFASDLAGPPGGVEAEGPPRRSGSAPLDSPRHKSLDPRADAPASLHVSRQDHPRLSSQPSALPSLHDTLLGSVPSILPSPDEAAIDDQSPVLHAPPAHELTSLRLQVSPAALVPAAGHARSIYDVLPQAARAPPNHLLPAPVARAAA
jgi:hypothetical protein